MAPTLKPVTAEQTEFAHTLFNRCRRAEEDWLAFSPAEAGDGSMGFVQLTNARLLYHSVNNDGVISFLWGNMRAAEVQTGNFIGLRRSWIKWWPESDLPRLFAWGEYVEDEAAQVFKRLTKGKIPLVALADETTEARRIVSIPSDPTAPWTVEWRSYGLPDEAIVCRQCGQMAGMWQPDGIQVFLKCTGCERRVTDVDIEGLYETYDEV